MIMLFTPGEQFFRRDLNGVLDNQRVITIFDISVMGDLQFRLDMVGQREPSLFSLPMERAQYLCDQGVWVAVEDVKLDGIEEIRRMLPTDQFTAPAHRKSMGFDV